MLNLRGIKRVAILGGGTAGWFAALEMRKTFGAHVEVVVVESPDIGIIGVGEGGLLNLMSSLHRYGINLQEFIRETGAAYKLGFSYERWRTGLNDDRYYHMFPVDSPEIQWTERGYFPIFSALVNHNIELSRYMDSVNLTEKQASQQEVTDIINKGKANFGFSFHFDSYRLGKYLKAFAGKKGVNYKQGKVEDFELDPITGNVSALIFKDDHALDVDFLVDASGFARLAIGKKYQSTWKSFSDFLLMDSAIPFHLKHPHDNPCLVTRAVAMSAGWMWQIPLQERIGAGFVFSSNHLTEDQAIKEANQYLGLEIEPMRTLRFKAGYFEKVWQKNVVAVGLASGFVEPLEATSIGQMLQQVIALGGAILDANGIISQHNIDLFNRENGQCWEGIADFLRMHYDSPRQDTPFWRDMFNAPKSEKYQELIRCWQHRTPRTVDFLDYLMDNRLMFNEGNWLPVGVAMGVIPAEATASELMQLSPEQQQRLAVYLQQLKQKLSNQSIQKQHF